MQRKSLIPWKWDMYLSLTGLDKNQYKYLSKKQFISLSQSVNCLVKKIFTPNSLKENLFFLKGG